MLPSNLFLKLLFGTVAQKLSCGAIPQGRTSISIPGRCGLLLSHGGGLGRSLNCVGRSQISLCIMLRRSVVHKLPFAAASEAFAWNRGAKVASQSFPTVLSWKCRAEVALHSYLLSFCMELSCKSCLRIRFLRFCLELSCKSCLARLSLKVGRQPGYPRTLQRVFK